jgi:hypothetical protein
MRFYALSSSSSHLPCERLGFHREEDQVEIFQDEKPKNLILNLPLHFSLGSGGKVSHSKRI